MEIEVSKMSDGLCVNQTFYPPGSKVIIKEGDVIRYMVGNLAKHLFNVKKTTKGDTACS